MRASAVKHLGRDSLVHAVRIAAKVADNEPQRNPVYVKALELMATALEEAGISSRSDGDYWLVKIPELKQTTTRP